MSTQHARPAASSHQTDSMANDVDEAHELIRFWRAAGPDAWFTKNPQFDDEFRQRFSSLHFAAARREREHWMDEAEPCLALVILMDQFPRNCFRGTAHMYATDPLARYYARHLIQAGHMEQIDPALRVFGCLPFVHSEDQVDQDYAVAVYEKYAPDSANWAHHHRDIIQRFGRFPHRNHILLRSTSPEEQRFLDEGGFRG